VDESRASRDVERALVTGLRSRVEFQQQQQSDKDVGRPVVKSWSVDTLAGRSEQSAARQLSDGDKMTPVYLLTSCPLNA